MKSKTWSRTLFWMIALSLVINLSFFGLHSLSVLVPQELIVERVREAFARQNLGPEDYPHQRFGPAANHAQIGLDQYTECLVILMTLYREEPGWRNAWLPKIAQPTPPSREACQGLQNIVEGQASIDPQASYYYLRYWFGARTVLSFLLPLFDFFQINNLIKSLTYLSYFLLGMVILRYARPFFMLFLPVLVLGILFSGIHYHGGLVNALPYLLSLCSALALVLFQKFKPEDPAYFLFFTVTGTFNAFFFSMSGATTFQLSLSWLLLYFVVFAHRQEREKFCALLSSSQSQARMAIAGFDGGCFADLLTICFL